MTKAPFRSILPVLLISAFFLAGVHSAYGVTYDTKKAFVKRNIPAGAKLSKASFKPAPAEQEALKAKWKWEGDIGEITLIIARDDAGKPLGTVHFTTLYATEHQCVHHIAVALKADGSVSEVVILELFCERAMPVASKSFLGQFRNKKNRPLALNRDINGITEATESSKTVIEAVNTAMAGYSSYVLNQHKK